MSVDPLTAGLELANTVVDKVFPDADAEQKRQLQMILAQTEVNKTEAAHASIFVAGWRPAAGWTCVAALIYTFIIYPLLLWAAAFFPDFTPPKLVQVDMLFELLFGMLGLAGLRSYEKIKEVSRERLRRDSPTGESLDGKTKSPQDEYVSGA